MKKEKKDTSILAEEKSNAKEALSSEAETTKVTEKSGVKEAKDAKMDAVSDSGNVKSEEDAEGRQEAAKDGGRRRLRRTKSGNSGYSKDPEPSLSLGEVKSLSVAVLKKKIKDLGLDEKTVDKERLHEVVFRAAAKAEGFDEISGILDIMQDGYGFIRSNCYLPGDEDCYIATSLIRKYQLRKGDFLEAMSRPQKESDKYRAICKVFTVNKIPVEANRNRPKFRDLTPVYPDERLVMEHGQEMTTARVIDLVAPIGKGQRGLIVSPPKAGKTTILKDIAASITTNNPEVKLMCLLVDERPEEVTDMERSVDGEVVSSTFDMPCENHIAVAELVIERAKRQVELGRDVVILLDSITRLARAYNLERPASGRVLSGGVDSTALFPPKRFLGAARNIEHGGSLTILASALIDTGSKMDEVIFEEFKGTGNMELKLDRNLADRRIFPAIDPVTSGTRKEELLINPQVAPLIWGIRRALANIGSIERATDMLIKTLKKTKNNKEFVMYMAKKAKQGKSCSDM
ncbi:MAG: transcription termination factor Rho [Eggerthellaceae bacterium]|nr:transcription termination factor Rho [Eggerthellaceae bacterium]